MSAACFLSAPFGAHDPKSQAYASRDRLQGRRPPLPESLVTLIQVRAPFAWRWIAPLGASLWLPPGGATLLAACRWAGARITSRDWTQSS